MRITVQDKFSKHLQSCYRCEKIYCKVIGNCEYDNYILVDNALLLREYIHGNSSSAAHPFTNTLDGELGTPFRRAIA